MRLQREMKVRPDLQLALIRQDIDHGASISRSPAAVVATLEGDLTPLEYASRLDISQRVGLRGIYLSLTDGRRPWGGGGVPASRLPPRSRKETTNCGEDHHKAVLSSKAVPPSKAQSKCEGQLLAIVGSSIPPGTSLRRRRRQKRAKSKVAAGATGEVILESTALMANPLQGGRWASRLTRN